MRRCPNRSLVLAALLCALARPLEATSLKRVGLRDLVAGAECIAECEVRSVVHAMSKVVEPGDAALPHTFVTFSIERLLKGRSTAGDSITLRFLGGPDGRGNVLAIAGVPRFRVGDRDILFVKGNGTELCPLLGFEQGRLRVVRGELFDDFGREIWVTPQGGFARGERCIDVRAAGYPELPRAEADAEERSPIFVPPAGSARPDATGMRAIVEMLQVEAYASGRGGDSAALPAVASADPGAVLRVPAFRRVAPPVEPVRPAKARPAERTPADDR